MLRQLSLVVEILQEFSQKNIFRIYKSVSNSHKNMLNVYKTISGAKLFAFVAIGKRL